MFQCVERLVDVEFKTSIFYKDGTFLQDVNKLVVSPVTKDPPRCENLYIHNILHTIGKSFLFVLSFDSQEHRIALLSFFVLLFNMNMNT